ncbi:hypothetical protein [Pseudooctadecabacter sp.]|uniref:hypothetical protein n=1 Tax=Pseudooctadecabacter sp. TaxID=1966338 RepID=UPI0035C7E613
MSDPVTNVEIEDVLSSIRRLVSDGDKARTAAPAVSQPDQPSDDDTSADADRSSAEWFTEDRADDASAHAPAENAAPVVDRFVLTPAFLVNDNTAPDPEEGADDGPHHEDGHQEDPQEDQDDNDGWAAAPKDDATQDADDASDHMAEADDDRWSDMAEDDVDHDAGRDEGGPQWEVEEADTFTNEGQPAHTDDANDEAPLELTNMVFDAPDDASDASDSRMEATDRSELVATIAELEAAVSKDAHDFEPDGSEMAGQTIAWPGAIARQFADADEAETIEDPADDTPDTTPAAAAPEAAVTFTHRDTTSDAQDDFDDDDLDENLDDLMAQGTTLDEDALRDLVSQVVREELSGPLGERITRNVRKLVRREIYRILSSQEFD